MKKILMAAALAASSGAVGCGAEPFDEETNTLEASLYGRPDAGHGYWNTSEGAAAVVRVCWTKNASEWEDHGGATLASPTPAFETAKEWVREAVENSWGRVANISFTGWDDVCPSVDVGADDPPNPNVDQDQLDRDAYSNAIMLSFHNFGVGAFYTDTHGKSPDMGTLIRISPLATTRVGYQYPIVHEFGHALGFAHEQQRPDNWNTNGTPKECMSFASNQENPWTGGTNYTSWIDEESILCYDVSPHYLSPGDIIGVQKRYGRRVSGSVVGYGGHCPRVGGENEHITAERCTTSTVRLWDYVTLSTSAGAKKGLSSRAAANLNWERKSTAQSATIRGQQPANDPLQEFPANNMRWHSFGNMCVYAVNATAGSKLKIDKCGVRSNERWDFEFSRIRLSGTNLCVRSPNASPTLGSSPTLDNCGTSDRQLFDFSDQAVKHGSMCMNVAGGLPVAGSDIVFWDGCGNPPVNSKFHVSGRLMNGAQCAKWSGGNDAREGASLLVAACNAAPVPDGSGFARPDPSVWDIYW